MTSHDPVGRQAPEHGDKIDRNPDPATVGGWRTPKHLDEIDRNPLPASAGRYPAALWAFVDAVAESRQVPRDMVFLLILSILSTSSGGRWRARIRPDWTETLAIYTATAMPSGSLKSPTFKAAADALVDIETQLQEAAKRRISEAAAIRELRDSDVERLKRRALKGDVSEAELVAAMQAAADATVPEPPVLFTDDVTPETLAVMMAQQNGQMGVLSPEGGLFAILAGRYSSGTPNLDLVLKSWSGDPVRVNRLSREAIMLPEPFLSIGVCIQPEILEGLAETRMFRASGLLARFFFAIPRTRLGFRDLEPDPVPAAAADAYARRIHALVRGASSQQQIIEMPLTPDAYVLFQQFRAQHEPKLNPEGGELSEILDWGSKLPGQLVRIAALFELFANEHASDVGATAIAEALSLAPYLTGQAMAAFDVINGRHARAARPRAVLTWIRRENLSDFTVRQAHRALHGQNWASSADVVKDVIEELEDLGWLRLQTPATTEQRGRGRPPSDRYEVNPYTHRQTQILSFMTPRSGPPQATDAVA